ncbi:HAD-IC family P-type ATPase, partial [Candidatus Falkowbacteria bacterium]|nr:HAD-IC family P-type ATPase [Candidatus Falkowbacteria bacterium]
KKKFILEKVQAEASSGLRTLGFAYALVDSSVQKISAKEIKKLTYLGFVGMRDPLRKESKATYLLTQQAGIRTIIITGDHKATAASIASQMGMQFTPDQIFEGADVVGVTDDELDVITSRAVVFARVQPDQKMRIVTSLKRQGEVVAMIGDGVNDAPALKASDIGVSVGSGTDVAKEASDMVLLDDNYKTIALAIKQGRILFDNIKKTTLYLLVSSFTEVVLVVLAIVSGLPLPLTALQILYINIVTDGFPHLTLGFEAGDENVMSRKPKKIGEGILSKEVKSLVFGIGLFLDAVLFIVYMYLYRQGYAVSQMQTMMFMILGVGSILYVFSCKSLTHSLLSTKLFDNMYIWYAVCLALVLHIGAYFTPVMHDALGLAWLSATDWMIVVFAIITKITCIEIGKYYFFTYRQRLKTT